MTTWYRHGSASVENGSRVVTGTITGWLNQAKPGDGITFDAGATWYEVSSVEGNTALTLGTDYAEASIIDGEYAIDRRSPRWTDTGTATMLMLQMLQQKTALITTEGKPDNTVGADGSLAFDPDEQEFYSKENGDWGDPISLRGDGGWAPVFALASDGERRVIEIVDWVGGTGDKPDVGLYIADDGLTEDIEDAVDVRGPQGVQGNAGWSAVTAIENDGARRVKRVVDWVGGAGSKPATGKYLGPTGYVDTPAEAADVRGPAGDGDLSGPGATVADGEIAVFDGASGSVLAGGGVTVSDLTGAIAGKQPAITTALPLPEQSAEPDTPASGTLVLFAGDDQKLRTKDSTGAVQEVGAAGFAISCVVDVFTNSGTWTKRPGLVYAEIIALGAGGGSRGSTGNGGKGGASSFGAHCSGDGGGGGAAALFGTAGAGIDGDININGGTGFVHATEGRLNLGGSGAGPYGGAIAPGAALLYGGGAGSGVGGQGGGGGGGCAIKTINAGSLGETEAVTVGAAGTAGSGTNGLVGAKGIVVVKNHIQS